MRTNLRKWRNKWAIAVLGVVVAGAMTGCPPAPPAHEEEAATAEIVLGAQTLYTLDDVAFEVHIEDAHGNHMMTLEEVHLEYRAVGSDTWREITLTAGDTHYTGTRIFTSSGDYEVRVLGMAHGGHDMDEMVMMTFTVLRAHADVGAYHIQYESDPGHIHTTVEAVLTFWVALEATGAPVTGLADAQIIVVQSDGHTTTLNATEDVEPGVYWALMTFDDAGASQVTLQFTGADSSTVTATFNVSVAQSH